MTPPSSPDIASSAEIAFILDLSFHANVDNEVEGGSSVVMRALAQPRAADSWPRVDGEWFEVNLRFLGVRDLRLSAFGPGPRQVMGFVIDDWSDRQLEGIAYKVADDEGDSLSFVCARIVIESRCTLQSPPQFLVNAE